MHIYPLLTEDYRGLVIGTDSLSADIARDLHRETLVLQYPVESLLSFDELVGLLFLICMDMESCHVDDRLTYHVSSECLFEKMIISSLGGVISIKRYTMPSQDMLDLGEEVLPVNK